jgi:RNA 3'-terminal phosphate cyclase (ATP)
LAGFTAVGERGLRPEEVGRKAAAELVEFLRGAGSVDEHLGDQLILPAALLAAGRLQKGVEGAARYRAPFVTSKVKAAAEVVTSFLGVPVRLDEQSGEVAVGSLR